MNTRSAATKVCDKWLKDRRERRLNLDDIRTYCRMVTAIGLTLAIQQKLDIVYADAENNLMLISKPRNDSHEENPPLKIDSRVLEVKMSIRILLSI